MYVNICVFACVRICESIKQKYCYKSSSHKKKASTPKLKKYNQLTWMKFRSKQAFILLIAQLK